MRTKVAASLLLAWVCLGTAAARAEQTAPRDIWPRATAAADRGDIDTAQKETASLVDTGKQFGIRNYPLYAASAVSLARQASNEKNKAVADWAAKAADQLDPKSPAVAFTKSDEAASQKNYGAAAPLVARGYMNIFGNYRTRLLSRCDSLIVLLVAIVLTAAVFAISLFIRYGRSMAHDFREILGQRFRGGSVTILAFALLVLPLFFWLGPLWLGLYWLVIFFGYAKPIERIAIVVLLLLLAVTPLVLDQVSNWVAGVDSPVVSAAIATNEQSYQPDALRRLQELAALVPDNASIFVLLGNLQQMEGNERAAAENYRKSVQIHDNAGAHVNIGNLHYFDNDFTAAITEYEKAESLDPHLAIAFYNHSLASGETYKFDDQAQKLGQARRIDRSVVDRLSSNPPPQKVVMYNPSVREAWEIASGIARKGSAQSLFGNYSYFDPAVSALNPLTIGSVLALILAIAVWLKRRRNGFAGSCIKCGRTFCHRCKSARESATYCTQCIHIYLKRDGVSLDTKRAKVEEVAGHHLGMARRNRAFATFLPGSGQLLEGRTTSGILGLFVFFACASLAFFIGRLAPVLATGELAMLVVRVLAIAVAAIVWLMFALPVWRRRVATS